MGGYGISKEKRKNMKQKTTHDETLIDLRRVEGQVRGVQRMIIEEKYCIDIVNQIHAVVNALYRVSDTILIKHIEHCVVNAFAGKSEKDKMQKTEEIIGVIKKLRKMK